MTKRYYRSREALPVALLITFVITLFFEVIVSDKSLYGDDFIFYFYPLKKFIQEYILQEGALPFWNPYQFSGIPIISNVQASMFYPLGFLYYVVPPEVAYLYSTLLHCITGSLFMYFFMRAIPISPFGSFAAALVFSFNGYFIGHLYAGHLSFVQTYIWIPLIFLLVYRFVRTGRFQNAVGAGMAVGVQILGGFPQISFYTVLGAIGFVLFYGVVFSRRGDYISSLWLMGGLIILLGVGFLLAAVQVLPTYEFTGLSTRAGGVSYGMATYESLHPKELLAFLIPDIFGNAVDGSYWRISGGRHHFWESCGYLGIMPLFLAFVRTEAKELRRLRLFFGLMVLGALFLALGKYNPLYPLVYKLPGFKHFRIPAQIIFLYVFSVAVLSGIGAHRVLEGGWHFNKSFVAFFALSGMLMGLFWVGLHLNPFQFFFQLFRHFGDGPVTEANLVNLYGRISLSIQTGALLLFLSFLLLVLHRRGLVTPNLFTVVVSSILIIDLYLFGAQFIKSYEFSTPPKKQGIVHQLHANASQGRVAAKTMALRANDGLEYGFPSILGYDPLILKRYVEYVFSSQGWQPHDHVVLLQYITEPNAKLLRPLHVNKMIIGDEVKEIKNQMPYATMVGNSVTKPLEDILPFMGSEDFDPLKMVVFEPEYGIESGSVSSGTFEASCSVLKYASESISLKTSANQAGYLVLSEIFYPGWQATVDGKRVRVLRGNYLFRVIPLDKGEHEVHLYFVSWPFRVGGVISLVTLVICACLLWLPRKRLRDTQG
ncbi:MAG: YfhO family protein [Pseudomonadota bacterium]